MKPPKSSTVLAILALLAGACSQTMIHIDPKTSTVESSNALTLKMEWLKIKPTRYDTSINLTGASDGPTLIWLKDITCKAANQDGQISTLGYRNTDGLIAFRRDESKNILFRCSLAAAPTGPYKITVAKVFANPSGDGHTAGKMLAKNVVLEQTGQ